jgi:hypothetical protein
MSPPAGDGDEVLDVEVCCFTAVCTGIAELLESGTYRLCAELHCNVPAHEGFAPLGLFPVLDPDPWAYLVFKPGQICPKLTSRVILGAWIFSPVTLLLRPNQLCDGWRPSDTSQGLLGEPELFSKSLNLIQRKAISQKAMLGQQLGCPFAYTNWQHDAYGFRAFSTALPALLRTYTSLVDLCPVSACF